MDWQDYKRKIEAKQIKIREALNKSGELLKRDDLTEADQTEVEKLQAQVAELQKQIDLLKSQMDAESEVGEEDVVEGDAVVGDQEEEVASERGRNHFKASMFSVRTSKKGSPKTYRDSAFSKYVRGEQLSERERSSLQEQRALTQAGASNGAEMVPQGFFDGYYEVLKNESAVRKMNPDVRIVTNTRSTPYPIYDDSANVGEIIGENSTPTGSATPATDNLMLGGKIFSSKSFSLSRQYIRNAGHDAEAAVYKMAAQRISDRQDQYFTAAMLTAATVPTGLQLSTPTLTFDVLIDLIDSQSAPYQSGSILSGTRGTLNKIKKLKDSHGDNIWFSGAAGNAPVGFAGTVCGVPFLENPWLPELDYDTTGALIYANAQRCFVIQELGGAELFVDPYTNGKKYMIDYTLFHESDGGVVDATGFKALGVDAEA